MTSMRSSSWRGQVPPLYLVGIMDAMMVIPAGRERPPVSQCSIMWHIIRTNVPYTWLLQGDTGGETPRELIDVPLNCLIDITVEWRGESPLKGFWRVSLFSPFTWLLWSVSGSHHLNLVLWEHAFFFSNRATRHKYPVRVSSRPSNERVGVISNCPILRS